MCGRNLAPRLAARKWERKWPPEAADAVPSRLPRAKGNEFAAILVAGHRRLYKERVPPEDYNSVIGISLTPLESAIEAGLFLEPSRHDTNSRPDHHADLRGYSHRNGDVHWPRRGEFAETEHPFHFGRRYVLAPWQEDAYKL